MKIGFGIILFAIGLILVPTFTPEDLVTSVPLLILFPAVYLGFLLPIGVLCLVIGFVLLAYGY